MSVEQINENILRKTQAATIIAKALGYVPKADMSPQDIISAALASIKDMSPAQMSTVREMLKLAESIGAENLGEVVEPDDTEWSEEDLDEMANSIQDWEDLVDAYEPGELVLVDEDTDEVVDELEDELREETLNEILSRVERIRAKIRFHRSSAKRQRRVKIALSRKSSSATINNRARKMAIKTMKMRLAKKPLNKLSVGEKERIERIMKSRRKIVDRLALRMTQRVRAIEKNRLSRK